MLGHWYPLLLLAPSAPLPPINGPTGGPNWLRGYKAPYDYQPVKVRKSKREEILFLTA